MQGMSNPSVAAAGIGPGGKALLEFRGRTFLEHVCAAVAARVSEVIVVAAPGQALPKLPLGVRVIRDTTASAGPLAGIRDGLKSALETARSSGRAEPCVAMIASCDLPLLRSQIVGHLIEIVYAAIGNLSTQTSPDSLRSTQKPSTFRSTQKPSTFRSTQKPSTFRSTQKPSTFVWALPEVHAHRQVLVSALSVSLLPQIEAYLAEGRRDLQGFAQRLETIDPAAIRIVSSDELRPLDPSLESFCDIDTPAELQLLVERSEASQADLVHDIEAATQWFSQWHIYRLIVDHDRLSHRGIHEALGNFVRTNRRSPFSLLDIGCGDAGFIAKTFSQTQIASYVGVDASRSALAEARRELGSVPFHVELVEADLVCHLADKAASGLQRFDLILAGYVVHHLPLAEKRIFFKRCRSLLAADGQLLFYDVCRRQSETRQEYLNHYVTMIRSWNELSPEALKSTCRHVFDRDFPETQEVILEMAREAGFVCEGSQIFVDQTQFHRLFCFSQRQSRDGLQAIGSVQ